jgi:hypothetical protein
MHHHSQLAALAAERIGSRFAEAEESDSHTAPRPIPVQPGRPGERPDQRSYDSRFSGCRRRSLGATPRAFGSKGERHDYP